MKALVSYVGGKSRLISKILPLFPVHDTYVEGFAGGAKALLAKPRSKVEVLNDKDDNVFNSFLMVQNHYPEIIRCGQDMVASRQWYDRLNKTDPSTLTEIQRAVRFFYLQKLGYGGLVTRHNYATHVQKKPNFSVPRMEQLIKETHKRLQDVHIENLPYDQIIKKYDRPTTFFYLDPPYYGIKLYNHNFEHDDFVQLEKNLKGIQGTFLLSINNHPEIKKIFADFTIIEVPVTYSLNNKAPIKATELLIKNY